MIRNMATLVLNKTPEKLTFGKTSVDFDVFLESLIDYMQDLEDVQSVKNEIKKHPESFDYAVIRKNYV